MDSGEGSSGPASFDVDEWDENFINEVFQVELNLSLANPVAPPLPVNPSASFRPKPEAFHSPPREMSQKNPEISEAYRNGDDCAMLRNRLSSNGVVRENKEVERLKKELKNLSKKFTHMEQNFITLKKERDTKSEQLKRSISQLEAKDAEIHSLKRNKSGASIQNQPHSSMCENKALSSNCVETFNSKLNVLKEDGSAVSEFKRRVMLDDKATTSNGSQECSFLERSTKIKCTKTKGIQTDISQDSTNIIQHKRQLIEQGIVSNLHAIWGLCEKRSGNTLVLKLLKTCSEDFFALFRCINMSSNSNLNGLANESFSEMPLNDKTQSIYSSVAAKISRFYQSLLKMRHGIVPLQAVIDALLDLCNLDNATVAHVSLRIMHATLQHLGFDSSSQRSNVFVGQSNEKSFTGGGDAFQMTDNANEAMPVSSVLGNLFKGEDHDYSSTMFLTFESLLNIFEMMRKIVARNIEEYIQLEGLSVMSLIMMESKSNTDREKFCSINLLQTLSILMSKECGVHVRKQVVRLLFLLFNSTKMLLILSSGEVDGAEHVKVDETQSSTATLQGEIKSILENIAECLILNKSDAEELKFQRRVIILLAFVASSGKNGFKLLLRSVTSQQINFLAVIVQLLASEMDAEMPNVGAIQDSNKERISLIREALILLNRLTSHPIYSEATLRALTGSKSTLNLTIDVANKLSRRIQAFLKPQHGTKRSQVPAEINDLARLFQLRIFSFLRVHTS